MVVGGGFHCPLCHSPCLSSSVPQSHTLEWLSWPDAPFFVIASPLNARPKKARIVESLAGNGLAGISCELRGQRPQPNNRRGSGENAVADKNMYSHAHDAPVPPITDWRESLNARSVRGLGLKVEVRSRW